ncbi:MAG TPA: tRNA adenosine(34) deaminase TadA [bacterium]|nr:tRNA adenosine(34) deaminase TadA [bacterium]
MSDERFMEAALREAEKAAAKKEAPIGAVAVRNGKVLARAHNLRESKNDPLGHAEIYLISKLARKLKRWRLNDVAVYVTLEPCLMCMGALIQARVGRLVFGAMDPKAGACGSLYDLSGDRRLNHRIEVARGVRKTECGDILSRFFRNLRQSKK